MYCASKCFYISRLLRNTLHFVNFMLHCIASRFLGDFFLNIFFTEKLTLDSILNVRGDINLRTKIWIKNVDKTITRKNLQACRWHCKGFGIQDLGKTTFLSDPSRDPWSCPTESCEHLWERLEKAMQQIVKRLSDLKLEKLTEKSLREIFDGVGDIDARWKRYRVVKKSEVEIVKRTELCLNCCRKIIFIYFASVSNFLLQHIGMKIPSIHVKHRSTWRKIFSVMIFCDAIFENFEEKFSLQNYFVLTGGGSSAHVDELYSKWHLFLQLFIHLSRWLKFAYQPGGLIAKENTKIIFFLDWFLTLTKLIGFQLNKQFIVVRSNSKFR